MTSPPALLSLRVPGLAAPFPQTQCVRPGDNTFRLWPADTPATAPLSGKFPAQSSRYSHFHTPFSHPQNHAFAFFNSITSAAVAAAHKPWAARPAPKHRLHMGESAGIYRRHCAAVSPVFARGFADAGHPPRLNVPPNARIPSVHCAQKGEKSGGQPLRFVHLLAAALLVFLTGTARTRIVSADFRRLAHNRFGLDQFTVDKLPFAINALEERAFMMLKLRAVDAVTGDEFHHALTVLRLTLLGGENLHPVPFRTFRPAPRSFGVELLLHRFTGRTVKEVDIARGIRRVAGTHQLFGRFGFARIIKNRSATFGQQRTGTARATCIRHAVLSSRTNRLNQSALHQLFGDLHRIQCRTLADVVARAPQSYAVLGRGIQTDAPNAHVILAAEILRHRIRSRGEIVHQFHTGCLFKDAAHFFHCERTLKGGVHRNAVRIEHRHADTCAGNLKPRGVQNLATLKGQLCFFGGKARHLRLRSADLRDDIRHNLVGKRLRFGRLTGSDLLHLRIQFLNGCASGTGDALESHRRHMAQRIHAMECGNAHQSDNGRTIRIGNKARTFAHHRLHIIAIDLGNHQRDILDHAEIVAIVNYNRALFDGHLAPHLAGTLRAFCSGEKHDVKPFKGFRRGCQHVERLSGDHFIALACGKHTDFTGRKVSLTEHFDHLCAHRTNAHEANLVLLHSPGSSKRLKTYHYNNKKPLHKHIKCIFLRSLRTTFYTRLHCRSPVRSRPAIRFRRRQIEHRRNARRKSATLKRHMGETAVPFRPC